MNVTDMLKNSILCKHRYNKFYGQLYEYYNDNDLNIC